MRATLTLEGYALAPHSRAAQRNVGRTFSTMLLIAVVAVTAVAVSLWSWHDWRQARRRRLRFQARDVLSLDDWYRTHIEPRSLDRETAVAVCSTLAGVLRCHTTQILPEDSFMSPGTLETLGSLGIAGDSELDDFWMIQLPKILGHDTLPDYEAAIPTVAEAIRYAQSDLDRSGRSAPPN